MGFPLTYVYVIKLYVEDLLKVCLGFDSIPEARHQVSNESTTQQLAASLRASKQMPEIAAAIRSNPEPERPKAAAGTAAGASSMGAAGASSAGASSIAPRAKR